MKRLLTLTIALFALAINQAAWAAPVKPAITPKAQQFGLENVKLLDSPFKHAMEMDKNYLLSIEPDRLLSGFRTTAGLTAKGKPYGGWEEGTLAGHSLGHYLTACSQIYAATADKRFLDKVNYIIDELEVCQNANGDGYVEAIPNARKIFAEVATGKIVSKGFDLNGLWSPWYNMHKVFAGLLDAYTLCGNQKALDVVKKFGDWAIAITSKLTEEQWQKMLFTEYGGMNDSLAELYALTGEKKYLDISRKFYDKVVLDPLANGTDSLPGRHSNTQIPKIIGLARLYELTGEKQDHTISEFFWDTVVHKHSYVIGGNSEAEYFGPENKLADRLSNSTCETCNTYNMLKLTEHLFSWTADAKYFDYYERALYNHILASQNPKDGMVCYFVPLKSGAAKSYTDQFDSFTCCLGTGMESHSKYGRNIYYHNDNALYVNLFIPSELKWKEKGLTLRQDTKFPTDGSIRLTFTCEKPVEFAVNFRYPYWATNGFMATINGKPVKIEAAPSSYVTFNRTWKSGDKLEIKMPLSLRTEPMPDKASRAAILYGPIVLSANFGSDKNPPPSSIPVLLTNGEPPSKWLKQTSSKKLEFKTSKVGKPGDVTLIPFFAAHDIRYAVYWDFFTADEWKLREAEIRADEERLRELESRTSDSIQLGEMQPERDHNFQGGETFAGDTDGRKFRVARDSWFSFEMKVPAAGAADLICTYSGGERRRPVFDILIDGEKLTTQTLTNDQPGKYIDITYALPESVIAGKSKVTVKLQASEGSSAGKLYGCRIVRGK
ncbi:MAG: glycoside hydrolase family 127 protein [Armatimonadetes bacterium]|nr:glycoside hydrolase family 127 protein [Armatimonadota bacterium]